MKLYTERQIPDDLAYVGARAHYINAEPIKEDIVQTGVNATVMMVDHLLEQQFESELVLKCRGTVPGEDSAGSFLRLLMDKERAGYLADYAQLRVSIPDDALLLLRK